VSRPNHHRIGYRIREFLRRLWTKSVEDDVLFMAGAIAFNVLVAIVPFLILAIGLAGYVLSARVGDPSAAVIALLVENFPEGVDGAGAGDALRDAVQGLVDSRSGFTLLGASLFLYLGTRLVGTLRTALREIFDIGQKRGILAGKLFDLQAVIVGLVLLTMNLGITVVVEAVMGFGVGVLGIEGNALSRAQWVLAHLLAVTSIWTLFLIAYRYLPARRIAWRTATIAATFSALLHEGLKLGFSWYVTEVANYGSAFGNVANVAVLFFWIYYGSIVFVLGGEVAQVFTMRKASRVGVMSFEPQS